MLLSNTLQGQVSGLLAQSSLGGLGKNASTLTIRGKGTNGDTTPLIIVDGMEPVSYTHLLQQYLKHREKN